MLIMSTERSPVAFVMMPFDPAFNDVFETVIRRALQGYRVVRADSHLNQQNILRSIAEGIYNADLVIADVSGTNPNVMYELGAAHALGKPTVMITRSLAGLPFDLRSYPVQVYSVTGEAGAAFASRLRQIGELHSAGQLRFGNPITDFLPANRGAATEPVFAVAAEPELGYGYLDYSADMEEYGDVLLKQFGRLNELSSQLVLDIRALAPAIHKARSSGSAKDERRLTNEFAGLLQAYADTVTDAVLSTFHEGWARVGHAMHWMVAQKPADVEHSRIAELCQSNKGLRDVFTQIVANVAAVREIVTTGRGRTGVLDKAVEAMEQAFNGVVSEVMIAECDARRNPVACWVSRVALVRLTSLV
jgi:hypothetical protein